MSGHGIPCECGSRFAGPEDAAAHLFWGPDTGDEREHKCGGEYESVWSFLVGIIVEPNAIPRVSTRPQNEITVHNGCYVLNYASLSSVSSNVTVIGRRPPSLPDALVWVDRNSGLGNKTYHDARVLTIKRKAQITLSTMGIQTDVIVMRNYGVRTMFCPAVHLAPAIKCSRDRIESKRWRDEINESECLTAGLQDAARSARGRRSFAYLRDGFGAVLELLGSFATACSEYPFTLFIRSK